MSVDRYIALRVAYDRHPSYGRSLGWIAPELSDAGLIMTEDHNDERCPSRTWAGIVDEATFERFADAWQLDSQPQKRIPGGMSEAGHLATRAYTFDGMNWEAGGESPIVYVSLVVGIPRNRDDAEPDVSARVRVHGSRSSGARFAAQQVG